MLVFFVAFSVLIVAWVFDSAAVDHRFVALGAVLPLVEVPTGQAWVLHTLLAPVVAFLAVAVLARGRRLRQRRWIGVPIGMFLHLVLDRTWTLTEQFWWPLRGLGELGTETVPELDKPALSLALEVAGVVCAWWMWRRAGLDDPSRRRRFLREGRLSLS